MKTPYYVNADINGIVAQYDPVVAAAVIISGGLHELAVAIHGDSYDESAPETLIDNSESRVLGLCGRLAEIAKELRIANERAVNRERGERGE
jgi:hypothetical protein